MAALCLAGRVLEDSPLASRAGAAALLDVPWHYRAAPFPFPFAPAGTRAGGDWPPEAGCVCTLGRPECASSVQSLFFTACTTDSGVQPAMYRAAIVVASCAWMVARSPASSRMNGIRASYQRDAPPIGAPRRSCGCPIIGCSDDAALPHRCDIVPSENRRRAWFMLPALRELPCRPSANPTQLGGTPAADASRDSARPCTIA